MLIDRRCIQLKCANNSLQDVVKIIIYCLYFCHIKFECLPEIFFDNSSCSVQENCDILVCKFENHLVWSNDKLNIVKDEHKHHSRYVQPVNDGLMLSTNINRDVFQQSKICCLLRSIRAPPIMSATVLNFHLSK
ncbi:hypothetical protein VNO78_10753 [Psophocarpus tetragonolobus]|uniref:Uncharacterized protein n=1 Tax=Psophocarpus tetragonolobus TaxID=3891 RepID=A0AAN9SRY4_PSOTE